MLSANNVKFIVLNYVMLLYIIIPNLCPSYQNDVSVHSEWICIMDGMDIVARPALF